jgi:acyl-CoA thioesterase YciA
MRATSLQSVFPQDTNSQGNLFAGTLVGWMDRCAAYAAMRRARGTVVTAAMDQINFRIPIVKGDLVDIDAVVESVGETSMRVKIDVWRERIEDGSRELCVVGHFTLVAVGRDGRPVVVPQPQE